MTRRLIELDGVLEAISPLEAPAAGNRICALLRVNLVDETTGRAPRAAVFARITHPLNAGVSVRVIDSGLIGVSGRPNQAFPTLLGTFGRLDLEIGAPRFLTHRLSVRFACAVRALTAGSAGNVLSLSSSANLVVAQRVLLSTADNTRVEFGVIAVLGPGANQITLASAPTSPFASGSSVQPLPADQRIDLHRESVSIVGRISQRTGSTFTPLANADVLISKVWRQAPVAGVVVNPEPPVAGGPIPGSPWPAPIASIHPPGYGAFASFTDVQVEDRGVNGVMAAKVLLDDVPPGATELRLSNGTNVGTGLGSVLAINADNADRRELVIVNQITAPGALTDWVRVRISQPLALLHRRGAIVRRLQSVAVDPTPPQLNYAAIRGDTTLLLNMNSIVGAHQIRLVDPGPPIAGTFHTLAAYATKTDAQGFYRLPALSRAGKIELFAQDSTATLSASVEFVPDYEQPENQLDVIVT